MPTTLGSRVDGGWRIRYNTHSQQHTKENNMEWALIIAIIAIIIDG